MRVYCAGKESWRESVGPEEFYIIDSGPRVRHILPSPSSTFADPPRPPPLHLSSHPVCPSLPHAPGASRSRSCPVLRVAPVPPLPSGM